VHINQYRCHKIDVETMKEDEDVDDSDSDSDENSPRYSAADSHSASSSDQDEHPLLPDNTVVDAPHSEDV
jgi:hypothetical protein